MSTAADGIRFLEVFMTGRLSRARTWTRCRANGADLPPLQYGMGLMRFALPRDFTLFKEIPPMVGHSGASGAVLYYVPALDLYVSGTSTRSSSAVSPTTCWRGSAWRARRRG